MIIQPTVGRVVWYRELYPESIEGPQYKSPQAAIVTYVHSDRMVNLATFDCNGNLNPRTSVRLVQDGDEDPGCSHCEWMPYQKGQAAKTEALEAQLK
jgi:hypothetical protein